MQKTIKDVVKAIGINEDLKAASVKHREKAPMPEERFEKIMELVGMVLFGLGVLAFFAMYIGAFALMSR